MTRASENIAYHWFRWTIRRSIGPHGSLCLRWATSSVADGQHNKSDDGSRSKVCGHDRRFRRHRLLGREDRRASGWHLISDGSFELMPSRKLQCRFDAVVVLFFVSASAAYCNFGRYQMEESSDERKASRIVAIASLFKESGGSRMKVDCSNAILESAMIVKGCAK